MSALLQVPTDFSECGSPRWDFCRAGDLQGEGPESVELKKKKSF